jgi:hypothetical protein
MKIVERIPKVGEISASEISGHDIKILEKSHGNIITKSSDGILISIHGGKNLEKSIEALKKLDLSDKIIALYKSADEQGLLYLTIHQTQKIPNKTK